jgi:PAS domain S-box-containing protein
MGGAGGNVEMQYVWFQPWRSANVQSDAWSWIGSVGLGIAVGAAYLLAAHQSLAQLTKPDCVAVFWPAAGIASGTLIALGPKARMPVALAVLIASAAASLMGGRSIPATIVFALCNAGEPLLVASLISRRFGKAFGLDSLRNVLGFFAGAGVGPALSAIVATAGFVVFYNPGAQVLTTWLNWFTSDALGIIMVAPVLIGLSGLRRDLPGRWELTEGALTLAALGAVSAFGTQTRYWWYTLLPLGLFLPALLAAHCRPVFAAAAALILGCTVVWTTALGTDDLGGFSNLPDRAYAARATLLAISIYTLVLAALFAERRHNERALEASNEQLKGINHRLQLALAGAELGVWSVDTTTGRFESDTRDRQIHGYRLESPPKTLAAARPFIHRNDLPALDAAFSAAKRYGGSCKVEYRLAPIGPDLGQERWVTTEGTVVRDADGRPLQLLGVTRDITERKQAERALCERNLQLGLAGKFALVGTYTYDVGSERYQVSPGYAAIHGLPEGTEETSRAEWRLRVHPSDLHAVEAGFEQAIAERRREYYCEYRFFRPDGEIRWIDSRNFISYDNDGSAPRLVGANIDVTQRKATEAALMEHKASLADALVAGRVVAFEWDAVTHQTRRSDNAARILGHDEGAPTGPMHTEFLRSVHPDDRKLFKSKIRDLSPDNPSYVLNFRFCCRDGRQIWLEETAKGEFNGKGRLSRIKGLTRDITARKTAELALVERNVQLALAGKAALVGSYAYDTDIEIMQISEGYAAIHGYPEGTIEIARCECLAAVHQDDVRRVEQVRSEAFSACRCEYSVEYRIIRTDRGVRWVETRGFITYSSEGRPLRVVGVSIDVTERKRVEEQQAKLVAELDHRVKNVLATVQTVAARTMQASSSMEQFVAALDGRIRSMGSTHELLSHRRWLGIPLAELVRRELAPYATGANTQFSGPEVMLSAEAGQTMAMVLHELVTNAAKHGSLSTRDGRVSVRWHPLMNGDGNDRLCFEWRETGGPAIKASEQPGYGMEVIRGILPYELNGEVDLEFATEGVRCRFDIPLSQLTGGDRLAGIYNGPDPAPTVRQRYG